MSGDAFRREKLKLLLLAAPVWLAAGMLGRVLESYTKSSWTVIAALAPLVAVVLVLGRRLMRDRRLVLGGGFLGFFLGYCAVFTIVAGTDLLNGKRTMLSGYEEAIPTNFLGLSRLGDWHYWLAPKSPPALDLVLVSLPSFAGEDPMTSRRLQAGLIHTALDEGAKGVAFDYYFRGESDADRVLCHWIRRAEEKDIPVVFGYRLAEHGGRLVRDPLFPESLSKCISTHRLGSLTGYMESDGRIRMVPLYVEGDRSRASLSYRIAEHLASGEWKPPDIALLQYTEPSTPPAEIVGEPREDQKVLFADRFVVVGSYRPNDRHATPFGELPGVTIHAYAAHSLRSGHFISRLPRPWLFPIVFGLCYLLIALQAGGGGPRSLLTGALLLSVAVLAGAALAMRLSLWVDVSYPLAATWLLTGMLTGGAALQVGRVRAVPTREEPLLDVPAHEAPVFDVFVSHNHGDKDTVRVLVKELDARGLHVWLDERELPPGLPWQEGVENAIETARSALVLVGRDGLGPWEVPEMRACLDECVRRRMPVIPVLLPGAGETPDLPLILRQNTWVDLRDGLTPGKLDRLEWGITGVKPR